MKYSAHFLALASVALAQVTPAPCPSCSAQISAVPACATSCISSAAVTAASCPPEDYVCECSSTAVIQDAALNCVVGACGIETGLQVLDAVSTVCGCVSASGCAQPTTSQPPTTSTDVTTTTTTTDETSTDVTTTTTAEQTSTDVTTTTTTDETSIPTGATTSLSTATPTEDTTTPYYSSSEAAPTDTTSCDSDHPTTTDGGGDSTSTCEAGSSADCGAVATSAVPSCAQACFVSAAPGVGCAADDYTCQCQPAAQASLSSLLVPCVATACPAAQLPSVIAGASSVCACATAPANGGTCSTGGGGGNGGGSHPTTTKPSDTYPTGGNGGGSGGNGGGNGGYGSGGNGGYGSGGNGGGSGGNGGGSGGNGGYGSGGNGGGSGGNGGGSGGNGGYESGGSSTCIEVTMTPSPTGGSSGGRDCSPLASSIESCAQACFSSAIPQVGCDISDYGCQCGAANQASLSALLVPCVATACQAAQLPSVIAEASAVCGCASESAAAGGGEAAPTPVTTTTCYPVGGNPTLYPTTTGSGSYPTGSNPAQVTAGANGKFELGVVGSIFGAAWLAAVAL